jgi:hypothetical protein
MPRRRPRPFWPPTIGQNVEVKRWKGFWYAAKVTQVDSDGSAPRITVSYKVQRVHEHLGRGGG